MASMVETLAKELERLLPLAKALAEVETKGAAAQRQLDATIAKQAQAEADAHRACCASAEAIAKAEAELQERTHGFKADLTARHAALSQEYDALKSEVKAARAREDEAQRAHKKTLQDLQIEIGRARTELNEVQTRLAMAKEAYAKALTGATA